MQHRREFLTGIVASLLANEFWATAAAQDVVAPTDATSRLSLTPTEQLMHSTVRLSTQIAPGITSWGTGFLFRFFNTNASHVPAIVTNRHVVKDMKQCDLSFAGRLTDGKPDLANHVPFTINEFDRAWIAHPSADLAIIPVATIFDTLVRNGTPPFMISLDQSLILTDNELRELNPVEQVLTVGFPRPNMGRCS
jgi:hypothetical protein